MLGHAVCRFFSQAGHAVVPLTREKFDIAAAPISALDPHLDGVGVVINCAGLIKPTIAAHPIEAALMVNSIFPRNLAKYCNLREIMCFHITTDCVFSGKRGRYTENDFVDCTDTYGLTKAGGDTAECMVLRTSIVGEEENQSRSLLEWTRSQTGRAVGGFTNHLWNGVTTVYLAEVIGTLVDEGRYARGLFHIHSPDTVTKMELVSIFSSVYELGLTITPTESPAPCDRSLASVHPLSGEVCRKPIRRQVEEMRDFFRLTALSAGSEDLRGSN
jgi:dTDP-4-dehydrorhamnose reductase